jgi:hypothetical protein
MESMMKLLRISISFLALFSVSQVFSEEATKPGAPAKTTEAAKTEETPEQRTAKAKEKTSAKAKYLADYQALPTEDPDLSIKNVNFLRKFAGSGRGEFLDVQFSLYTQKTITKEYSVYVLAVHESTAPVYYPVNWRPNDPQKNIKKIKFQALAPEILKEDDVLTKVTSEDMKKYIQEKRTDSILDGATIKEPVDPNLDDYIYYLTKNQDKALKVKVFGHESPKIEEQVTSNIKFDQKELDRDVNYSVEGQTYTIQANKYFTTVSTHHFSIFRPEYYFFNKVVILIFDPERPRNKLIYRGIFDIGKQRLKG